MFEMVKNLVENIEKCLKLKSMKWHENRLLRKNAENEQNKNEKKGRTTWFRPTFPPSITCSPPTESTSTRQAHEKPTGVSRLSYYCRDKVSLCCGVHEDCSVQLLWSGSKKASILLTRWTKWVHCSLIDQFRCCAGTTLEVWCAPRGLDSVLLWFCLNRDLKTLVKNRMKTEWK